MRWVWLLAYAVAFVWLFLSLSTFFYNYTLLKRMEEEITRLRVHITVWRTDMGVMQRRPNR